MEILKIVFSSLVSLASLFILTKLLGNREMAQLSMFDYICSIALGSIAGEMAVMSTGSIILPLVAMLVFSIVTLAISYFTCKSIYLRRLFEGQAIILYQDGQIFEKNLLKAKMDVDEVLSCCRISGYYDLEEIHTVYLEANGQISVLPMSAHRPCTPNDLKIDVPQSYPLPNVIIDGKIMQDNLKSTGKNETWLQHELKEKGVQDIKEIILATFDQNKDTINVYFKFHRKMLRDIFE